MSNPSPACHKCGRPLGEGRVEFRAVCAGCGEYLHCCLNCGHFDPAVFHECRASATTEYCVDKDKGNFCEEFRPGNSGRTGGMPKSRAEIEKLFPGLS